MDASSYENVSRLDPPLFLGRVFGCCSGRLLVAVALGPWFRFVSVGFNSGRKRAPTPKPAVIRRSLFGWQPFLFRCSGTLDLSVRSIASAGHMVVCVVTVQMVGDRRFPGRQYWGSRSCTSSTNLLVSVPPTDPEHSDASWCGQCTRWQVQYSQTGATLRRHFSRAVGTFVSVAATTSAWCRAMLSCDGISPIVLRAGEGHPEMVTYTPHKGSSQPPQHRAPSQELE